VTRPLAPGLLAECLGQSFLELPDACVEAGGALVGGEQVGLQGRAGDGRPGGCPCGRGGFERVDLLEEVAVPVEERAVNRAARAIAEMLISVSAAPAWLIAAMTRWRRRAESACRSARIFSVLAVPAVSRGSPFTRLPDGGGACRG
jgi:hypothetical protein